MTTKICSYLEIHGHVDCAGIETLLLDPTLTLAAGDFAQEHTLPLVGAALAAAYQKVL